MLVGVSVLQKCCYFVVDLREIIGNAVDMIKFNYWPTYLYSQIVFICLQRSSSPTQTENCLVHLLAEHKKIDHFVMIVLVLQRIKHPRTDFWKGQ